MPFLWPRLGSHVAPLPPYSTGGGSYRGPPKFKGKGYNLYPLSGRIIKHTLHKYPVGDTVVVIFGKHNLLWTPFQKDFVSLRNCV